MICQTCGQEIASTELPTTFADRIAIARRAREVGLVLRKGKPASFRPQVGRGGS